MTYNRWNDDIQEQFHLKGKEQILFRMVESLQTHVYGKRLCTNNSEDFLPLVVKFKCLKIKYHRNN